ncbi:MAG: TatD family hydrolase [Candidatus Omnitrophota bacterium]
MLVDSHCHINSFPEERIKDIIFQDKEDYLFIDVSIDRDTAAKSLSISGRSDCVYTSLGFHPFSAQSWREDTVIFYRRLIDENKKIVAIGEVGLDYKSNTGFNEQRDIFVEFIILAKEYSLPLVVHNRWQDDFILNILDEHFDSYEKIVFHCFSQDKNFLARILDKKGHVSFSLNVLRQNKKIKESLGAVSLDNLLLETDSPYMKVNNIASSPLDIGKLYDFIAKEKGVPQERLCQLVSANAKRVFAI